ncbi:ATP-binding cassette domain-containing protein [Pseudarthrobacter sp. J75]|uniref:sulfate/molybdate ABC transporter ATP-binding protein n=1 Tax=unclassified Pseudarthrobacter TaxID=2647000 RepID=UPI002E820AE0|nr:MULTISPECIES: ATP-binding cassette domain-containing protein [unclassified Pseudarthrobacter]MEE2522357.1 ATP-binding cassette domain-containing protein [Pseudarthrobacter sp. J47]MEE2527997.1 ATP-binding cassette domain-containing protein [Pseudarthrobacter sp. J75]
MTFSVEATVRTRDFDVRLAIAPGETVAVMGPNGAGKSTLLGVIAGLLKPDSGTAESAGRTLFKLDGGPHHWEPPHRRGTVLLAQEALLFPHLSVLENTAFAPRSAGVPAAKARETARHWLAAVDALDLAARKPGELSGGQAQRVAVARALAAEPDLLLLDEPLAALDITSAPLLRRLLKKVLAGRGAIIVTHDVLDALMLADRVVILDGGRIVEEGRVREVLDQPRSRFAAGLSGVNFVTGTLIPTGLRAGDGLEFFGHQEAGFPAGSPAASGADGVAVFPPSAVSVFVEPAHGSPRNSFPVTVAHLEPHGDQIRVRAAGAHQLAADVTPQAAAELGLAPGMTVYFVVKAGSIAIYPA